MKKLIALLLAACLLLGLMTTAFAADEKSNDIVILYTNDVHCAVDDNIGYAGLAAYKKEMQAAYNYVALVDCGDSVQGDVIGTLSKGEYLVDIMNEVGYDFVYVHIEAPDEMGHQGSTDDKIKAIELIDDIVIGPVAEGLEQAGEDYRMLILPDHPTPVRVRTHTGDPVPYMLYDSTNAVKGQDEYSERTAQKTGIFREKGDRLIDHLLERE